MNWIIRKGLSYLMGNKLGRRRSVVDEKYTKPQGLYQHRDIDIKKLRKLILESKLAPCYPGDEDCSCDLEECPICFLSYEFEPLKVLLKEHLHCAFCKTYNYAVEYRGTKTKKEKSTEQIEEQRVIEAKIRMRQQELQEEEEKFQQRKETLSTNGRIASTEVNYREATDTYSRITSTLPDTRPSRDGEFSVDLDDIMVMEAIWLSMQKNNKSISDDYITSEHGFRQDFPNISLTPRPASSSAGGLASAIATLVEHQRTGGRECSTSYDNNALTLTRLPNHSQHIDPYHEFHAATRRAQDSRLSFDYLSEQESESGIRSISGPVILPESFEEQMTLAMTLSLAEAHAPLRVHRGLTPRH